MPSLAISPLSDSRKHPPALWFLAFSETWERFSYYGMQTLLTLYLATYLLNSNHAADVIGIQSVRALFEGFYGPMSATAFASAIFGLYTGFVYLTPVLGGLIADRLLGKTATITLGAALMVAGHFAMAFEPALFIALALLLIGTGCFKGNIASQLGSCYKTDDARRSHAFQIFYLGISFGAILAPLVCGTIGERLGWHLGFAAAGVGMIGGLAIYLAGRKHYPISSEPRPPTDLSSPPSRQTDQSIWFIVALIPILAMLAIPNQQIFNAYLIWSKANYDFTLFGMTLPTTWLVALDAATTVALLGTSVAGWRLYARFFPEPDEFTKLALSGIVTMLAFLILVALSKFGQAGQVSLVWAVVFHSINSLAFANMIPVGLSLFSRTAPARLGATAIGIYYTHLFVANNMVGWLGGFVEALPAQQFWLAHVGIAGVGTISILAFKVVSERTGPAKQLTD